MELHKALTIIDSMIEQVPDKSDLNGLFISNEIFDCIEHLIINNTYKGFTICKLPKEAPKKFNMIKRFHR